MSKHNYFGLDVDVQHEIKISLDGLTTLHLGAVCGQSRSAHTITIGAVDSNLIAPPSVTELQRQLDDGRLFVAREVAWKEHVRVLLSQLV